MAFSIKNISDYSSVCESSSQIAVGRLFLIKSELVFRVFSDKIQAGFNETTKKSFNIYLIVLVLMGILIISLIISIVLLKFCQRVKSKGEKAEEDEEDADYYNKVEEEA